MLAVAIVIVGTIVWDVAKYIYDDSPGDLCAIICNELNFEGKIAQSDEDSILVTLCSHDPLQSEYPEIWVSKNAENKDSISGLKFEVGSYVTVYYNEIIERENSDGYQADRTYAVMDAYTHDLDSLPRMHPHFDGAVAEIKDGQFVIRVLTEDPLHVYCPVIEVPDTPYNEDPAFLDEFSVGSPIRVYYSPYYENNDAVWEKGADIVYALLSPESEQSD